jgi:hypothetical protein
MAEEGASGRDDLGGETGRRRIRRPAAGAKPLGSAVSPVERVRVQRKIGSRLPVSGSDVDKQRVAAQSPWTCEECGHENRYYVFRCKTGGCEGKRPW